MVSTVCASLLPMQSAEALPARQASKAAALTSSATSNGLFAIFKNEDWGSNTSATPPISVTATESCGSIILPTVNYNWSGSRPNNGTTTLSNCGTVNGGNIDKFSAMISGYLLAPVTGTIDFYDSSDDGFVLNIGGTANVINNYQTQASSINPFNSSGSISVTAGNIYPIQIFYHQQSGGAVIGLYWTLNSSCVSGAAAISSTTCTSSAVIVPQSNLATSAMAFGTGCVIGSSQYCPGTSASEIKAVTGTNTNGLYWITVGYTSEKVYCLMDSNLDGGGWMLTMKGSSNNQSASTTFNYSSSYWTNTTTLNPNDTGPLLSNSGVPSCSTGNSAAAACPGGNYDENAKFDTFANTPANQVLVNYPDIPTSYGGGRFPSNNSYGFMWEERMDESTAIGTNNSGNPGGLNLSSYTYSTGSNCPTASTTLVYLFTNSYRCAIRQVATSYSSSENPYSVVGNNVFSTQTYISFLALNYTGGGNKQARIGLGYNENGTYDETSNDVVGGIGFGSSPGSYQAGDYIGCCQSPQTGLNRKMGYELYVRNLSSLTTSNAYLQTPAGSTLTQSTTATTSLKSGSSTSVAAYWIAPTSNSSLSLTGITVTGSGVVTVGATASAGTYPITVEAVDAQGSVSAVNMTIVVTPSGPTDYAGSFNSASSQYAEAGNRPIPTGANNFTVEAWIYANTLPASGFMEAISQGGGGASGFDIGVNSSGQIRLGDNWTSSSAVSNVTIQAGQWYHIAVLHYSGGSGALYLNGSYVDGSNSYSVATTATGQNLRIGTQYNNGSVPYTEYWNGKVDEVKIYNTTLSQTDIKGDMTTYGAYDSGVAANLVDYFDFNEGSGSYFYNHVSGAASSSNLVLQSNAPTWSDIKSAVTTNGVTVVTFPRSYLTATGGYTAPTGISQVSYLAVAGGGGGGCADSVNDFASGGGGAGGLLQGTMTLTPSSVYTVNVGIGGITTTGSGVFASSCSGAGTNGGNSIFNSVTAVGGGGGGSGNNSSPYYYSGNAGGSGGGAVGQVGASGYGSGTSGQGNSGGSALTNGSSGYLQAGGGGGGSSGAGATPNATPYCTATSYPIGGAGGAGTQSSITGSAQYYAAGGGGATRATTYACGGAGGSGIGGKGSSIDGSSVQAGNGAAGTGSGGGGTSNIASYAGRGGSGIVIFAYLSVAPVVTAPNSITTTAGTAVTFTDTNTAISTLTRTFQWQYETSVSGPWQNVATGSTNSTSGNYTTVLATVSMSGYLFRVIVTDTDGSAGLNTGASLSTTTAAATLTVNPQPITIAPASVSKNFGASDPALTGVLVSGSPGLFNGDTVSVTETRTVGQNAGSYTITPSAAVFTPSADAANYSITYTTGLFTINPYGTLVITPVAPPSLTYSGSAQSFTESATVTGNAAIDPVSVSAYTITGNAYANGTDNTGTGTAFNGGTTTFPTNAGAYVLTPTTLSFTQSGGVNNYARVTYNSVNFTVDRSPRTETATAATSVAAYQSTDQVSLSLSGGVHDGNYSYSSNSYCSVNSTGLVTMLIGNPSDTCTVTVYYSAGANYLAASPNVTVSITPARISQPTINIVTQYGIAGSPFPINFTGGAGVGGVVFSLVSSGTAGCTISGSIVTPATAGSCVVQVTRGQDDYYSQATSQLTTLTFYVYVNHIPSPVQAPANTPSQISGGVVGGGINSVQTNGTVLTVTGITPTSGASGTTVVLTGTGFISGGVSTIRAISFNSGLDIVPFTVNSATQITLTIPSGETGVVDQFAIQPINGTTVFSPTFTGL